MTAADVLGRVDELTDGTGGSVDAVMGAALGPYRKSRFQYIRNAPPDVTTPLREAVNHEHRQSHE